MKCGESAGSVVRPARSAQAGRVSSLSVMPGTATLPRTADVAVIGAGAAGLTTAIAARRSDPTLRVFVLDGAAKPGAKILVSGGTRCNVTNVAVTEADFWGGRR